MSRYLLIGDAEEGAEISSNTGWSQFLEWVSSLDQDEFPSLVNFSTTGTTDDAQLLRDQVESATEDSPPIPDVAPIAENLLEYLDGETGSVSVV
jgi:hypothetical protein